MRVAALIACALVAACAPALDVPSDAVINCIDSAQCPDTMSCRASLCVRNAEIDRSPPTLVSAQAAGPEAVVLTFSERITRADAEDLANYASAPPLAFVSARLGGEAQTVVLAVQRQSAIEYTLTITGVRDESDNVIASPSNRSTFMGVPPPVDRTPPEALVPALHQRLLGASSVELRWSERSGATNYVVDVALDAAFQNPIAGSPFTVSPTVGGGVPAATLTVSNLQPLTHYWRVHADTTDGVLLLSDFDIVRDALHVYCPSYPGCPLDGTDDGAAGNVTRPYRTITRALANAKLDGIRRVNVAGRGAGASYEELVTLVDGVSLHGGYEPTFDEATRGVETSIRNSSVFTIYAEHLRQKTVLEGFTIYGGAGRVVHTIQAIASDGLILINDVVDNGLGEDESFAVNIESSGDVAGLRPLIAGCTIIDASEVDAQQKADIERGINAVSSHIRIEGSSVTTGDAISDSSGVFVRGSVAMGDSTVSAGGLDALSRTTSSGLRLNIQDDPPQSRIERCSFRGGRADASYGVLIEGGTSGTQPGPYVVNNTIRSGVGSAVSGGAYLVRGTFVNNTVAVVDCTGMPTCQRIVLSATSASESSTVIANNILFGQASVPGGTCLEIRSGAPSTARAPRRIENNLMFDCPGSFVRYAFGSAYGTQLTTIADVNDPAKYPGTPPESVTANITDVNGASYFTGPAMDEWSLTSETPPAIMGGGLDSSSAEYGTVDVDITNRPRTCGGPGVCYSIGAYERD